MALSELHKNDFRGIYLETKDIPDTKTWKRVIDALLRAGAEDYQGYGPSCFENYLKFWQEWKYIGVTSSWKTYHANSLTAYSMPSGSTGQVSLEFILGDVVQDDETCQKGEAQCESSNITKCDYLDVVSAALHVVASEGGCYNFELMAKDAVALADAVMAELGRSKK